MATDLGNRSLVGVGEEKEGVLGGVPGGRGEEEEMLRGMLSLLQPRMWSGPPSVRSGGIASLVEVAPIQSRLQRNG